MVRTGTYEDMAKGRPKPKVTGARGQAVVLRNEVVLTMEGRDSEEV